MAKSTIAAALILLGVILASPRTLASTGITTSATDESALRAQAAQYQKAFSAGNAAALAAMWLPDGRYIDCNGQEFRSRASIQKTLEDQFKVRGVQPMQVTVRSITFPATNVAVEEGTCTLMSAGAPQNGSDYIVVHVKSDGKWQMLSATETSTKQNFKTVQDLGWLAGDWVSDGDSTIRIAGSWDNNHHFIRFGSRHTSDAPVSGEYQIIGSNPVSKNILSWHFDSTGGYGQGNWSNEGDTWYERAYGMQPDGKISHARYVIRKINNDKFTWRSTDRSVDGMPIPDTKEVTITRSTAGK